MSMLTSHSMVMSTVQHMQIMMLLSSDWPAGSCSAVVNVVEGDAFNTTSK